MLGKLPKWLRVSDSSVFAETVIYKAFVLMAEIGIGCCIFFLEERETIKKLEGRRMDLYPIFLYFKQCKDSMLVLPSQQRLHKLHFLQKLDG